MTITFGDVRASISRHHTQQKSQDESVSVRLHRGDVMSLPLTRRGVTIRSLTGQLWVTREGDPADHLLNPGETFPASGSGLLVIQALSDATASIAERSAQAFPRPTTQ